MKRNLAAVLAGVFLVSAALAGCGGTVTTTPSASPGQSASATPTPAPKQYTLSMFSTRVQPDPDSDIFKEILEKLGHKVEVTAVADSDYSSKLNLFIAANEIPDIFDPLFGSVDSMRASAALTEADLQTYMPQTWKTFTERLEKFGFAKENVLDNWSFEGRWVKFGAGAQNNYTPYGLLANTTLLTDLGISMPTTIDEWGEAFKLYKAKYPDKYPLSARGKSSPWQSFYMFYASYGVSYNNWVLEDGQLVYGPSQPAWRDCLSKLAEWYQAGYINPEWFTMDSQAFNNDFTNGNIFLYPFYGTQNKIEPPYDEGTLLANAVTVNPQATFDWAPFPVWKSDVKPLIGVSNLFSSNIISFGSQLEKDPDKLHAAMQILDMLSNDEAIYMLKTYGVEGVTYDMVNGLPTVKQEYSTEDAKGKAGFGWGKDVSDVIHQEKIKPDYAKANYNKLIADPDGYLGANKVQLGFNRVTGELVNDSGENLNSKNSTYATDWDVLFTAIIIGQKPVTAYDEFIAQWKKDIGDEMTALANKLYLQQWLAK